MSEMQKRDIIRTKIQNDLHSKDFYITRYFLSEESKSGIYYDDKVKQFGIVRLTRKKSDFTQYNYSLKIIDSKDILESEILQDDVSITKTSRGGQLAGALIGGVLAGGVGAVIGGVTSSKSTTEKIKKLTLRITVNDTSQPIIDIVFADFPSPKNKNEIKFTVDSMDYFHKVISVLLKQNDNEKNQVTSPNTSNSVADELRKLSELRNDGILSEDEFQQQKQKILSI